MFPKMKTRGLTQIQNNNLTRTTGEEYDDYFVRLFENRIEYGISFDEIAALLNHEKNQSFGESAYRKCYADFNRGRIYERKRANSNISTRILCISDLHCPYQIPADAYKDYKGKVDILMLNGDIIDCQSLSSFPKLYRSSPIEEIISGRAYLIEVIETIAPKQVVVTYGNHDLRLQNYIANIIDNDIQELLPTTPLDLIFEDGLRHYDRKNRTKTWYEPLCNVFPEIKITYTGNWYAKIGKTIFAHPLAYSNGILKTASKAVDYFLRVDREFDCLVLAHTHRIGFCLQGDIKMYEQGASCRVEEMRYSDGKLCVPQQKGFIYLCQDKSGNVMFDDTKIINLN